MIRIGGLGPLSSPGIPWAGRELQDGMALAVKQLNDSGGVLGRPLISYLKTRMAVRKQVSPLSKSCLENRCAPLEASSTASSLIPL